MGKLADAAVKMLTENLASQGERIVKECLQEKDYKHDTYNLHDSYGYGVYYKGALVKHYTPPQTADEGKKWYGQTLEGHQEIMKFLNGYKASQGFELVIAAAMPYAEVLEDATSGQHRKYKVISMAFDKLDVLCKKNPQLLSYVVPIFRGRKQGL